MNRQGTKFGEQAIVDMGDLILDSGKEAMVNILDTLADEYEDEEMDDEEYEEGSWYGRDEEE